MEHREEIWNLLHDGGITAVGGRVPGDLTIRVEIDYLTRRLQSPCEALWLTLVGCDRFEYWDWTDDHRTLIPSVLATVDTEILSATDEADGIRVICAKGRFDVRYAELRISKDDGTLVPVSQLREVARKYWDGSEGPHSE